VPSLSRLEKALVHASRDTTYVSRIVRHGVPDDLTDFLSDLLDGIHGPQDIKVFILINDLRVDDSYMRLEATFKALEKSTTIH
jgi:hypothetical protein